MKSTLIPKSQVDDGVPRDSMGNMLDPRLSSYFHHRHTNTSSRNLVHSNDSNSSSSLNVDDNNGGDSKPPTRIQLTKYVEFNAAVIGGCLLNINAGCINAITIMETGFATSHMTSSVTRASIDVVDPDHIYYFFKVIGLVCSFTFGSMLTGLLGGQFDEFKLGHTYGRIFQGCTFLLLIALVTEIWAPNEFTFVFFCATACGMQNAMTTKFSGSMIRTSHVTSALTDIGIVLGRMLRGRKELSWKLWLLVPMIFSFFAGGVMAALIHPFLGRMSLLINVFVFGFTTVAYHVYFASLFNITIYQAITGKAEFTLSTEQPDEKRDEDSFDFNAEDQYILANHARKQSDQTKPTIFNL